MPASRWYAAWPSGGDLSALAFDAAGNVYRSNACCFLQCRPRADAGSGESDVLDSGASKIYQVNNNTGAIIRTSTWASTSENRPE
jgi:hypothetical protein